MALCLPQGCGCAIQSSSIDIDGDGSGGNPYVLTALGTYVCTSGTRPTGIQGLEIYETDTLRTLIYDGTNWIIQSGQWPGCVAYTVGGSQSTTSGVATTVALATEVYDIGGFHTSTNGFFTIPSGMAGDYQYTAYARWAGNATGQRTVLAVVASNGSIVNSGAERSTTFPTEATSNSGVVNSGSLRLVAGATVTLQAYQTSLGALNVTDGYLTLDMIRHIPTLA